MGREKRNISKRIVSFRHSDSPLTSERVSVILSNREDSALLAKAVRSLRLQENMDDVSFKVSDFTENRLSDLEKA